MTTSRALAFALTVSSAALSACGPAIRSDRDESIPIPMGATWTGGPRPELPVGGPSAATGDEIVRQRFERAIAAAMEAKGIREVADAADAVFVLTLAYEPGRSGARQGPGGVSIGVVGGWGGGWGRPRYGGYPWGWTGWYDPWGWSWWAPLWMSPAAFTAQGPPAWNREGDLVVKIRHRESGYVAWTGRVATSSVGSPRLSQRRVQAIVDRLLRTFR